MRGLGRLVGLLGLVVFVLAAAVPTALAVPFDVTRFDDPAPNGCNVGDCSLREAVIAANTAGTADSIALDPGTYALAIPNPGEDAAATGDLDITDDLTLTGAGSTATTIDGNRITTDDRVLDLDPGVSTTPVIQISGLRITDGGDAQNGGGIRSQALAQVTLSQVAVSDNNTSGAGGGILVEGSSQMTIEDSSISDNRATSGGGLRNQATASTTIRRTTLDRNVATSSSGGGIFSQIDAALTVEASTVSRNGASSNGGGLFLQNDGSTAILNSTVSGNLSFGNGGGIFLQNDQTMTMASSTVTNNRSIGEGGGIRSSLDPGASLTVGSTIFAGNEAADPGPDCFVPTGEETIASAGNNLVGDGTGCDLAAAVGDQVGSGSAPIDPGLGPLAANGGPTETHLPSLTSPAIDAGDVGALPGDQRGLPRTIDQPGVPNAPGSDGSDVGATELALVPAPRCKGAVATIFTIAGGPATLNGSPRRDVIVGTTAGDKINAKGGNDLVCAKGGADTVRGGAGNDRLFGEGGRDRLLGGGGRDLLSGGGGRDRCVGGPGRDTLRSC